jgi:hypothetical protein
MNEGMDRGMEGRENRPALFSELGTNGLIRD